MGQICETPERCKLAGASEEVRYMQYPRPSKHNTNSVTPVTVPDPHRWRSPLPTPEALAEVWRLNGEVARVICYGISNHRGTVGGMRVSVVKQESLIDIDGGRQMPSGMRQAIQGYNSHHRRALREAVHSIEPAVLPRKLESGRWHRPGSFATLTYPAIWPKDPAKWKRDLLKWGMRLQRKHPGTWAIWALEIQRRGAPHYHLIVRWPRLARGETWKDRQAWLSLSWAQVVAGRGKPVDPDHLKAGTNIKPMVTSKALVEYLAKPGSKITVAPAAEEMSKLRQKTEGRGEGRAGAAQGRWWGIHNRRAFKACATKIVVDLPTLTRARLYIAIERTWREFERQYCKTPMDYLPQWAAGRDLRQIIEEAALQRDLFAALQADADTGELVRAALTETDYGEARSA